jgi:hypothetical protein
MNFSVTYSTTICVLQYAATVYIDESLTRVGWQTKGHTVVLVLTNSLLRPTPSPRHCLVPTKLVWISKIKYIKIRY